MNEQKVLFELERDICRRILRLCHPLYAETGYLANGPWRDGGNPELPHRWFLSTWSKSGRQTVVTFKNISYRDSDRVWGESSFFPTPALEDSGFRETLIAGPDGMHERVKRILRSVTEEHSDYNIEAEFSVTNTSSAEAKAGVEGIGEASVSTETTTTARTAFGQSGGFRNVSEKEWETETQMDIPPNEERIFTIDFMRSKEVTPYTESAYVDFDLEIDFYDWAGKFTNFISDEKKESNVLKCDTWQEFLWFWEGERPVEFPGMDRFLRSLDQREKEAYLWLANRENRRVEMEGNRTRWYDYDTEKRVRAA